MAAIDRRPVIAGRPAFALALCAGTLVSVLVPVLAAAPAVAQTMGPTLGSTPMDTLHRSLKLTPEQEPAWKAYRDGASVPEKAQGRRRAAAKMFPTLSSPQRMDLVEAEMKQELLDLQHQSQALKTFYATLSPDQKRVFDIQTLPPRDGQQPEE